jgi:hypothetical protein
VVVRRSGTSAAPAASAAPDEDITISRTVVQIKRNSSPARSSGVVRPSGRFINDRLKALEDED